MKNAVWYISKFAKYLLIFYQKIFFGVRSSVGFGAACGFGQSSFLSGSKVHRVCAKTKKFLKNHRRYQALLPFCHMNLERHNQGQPGGNGTCSLLSHVLNLERHYQGQPDGNPFS